MPTEKEAKLISLFFGAFVLLNFPIVSILSNQKGIGGVPLLFYYFFFLWIIIIVLTYRVVERKNKS
jgi:hypothetical protein